MERETLNEKTGKELAELIRERNERLGMTPSDPGYVPVKGRKDDLIDRILEQQTLMGEKRGLVTANDERTVVKSRQLVLHSHNYRHEVDYYDPQLVAAFKKSDLKFFQEVKVTPDEGKTNAEGEQVYNIVSGNRSVYNFRKACEEMGVDPDDRDVPVSIRTYEGSEQERAIAERLDIGKANTLQREMSPVDLMRWYTDLQKTGMSQGDIAAEVLGDEKRQGYVSRIIGLGRLPDRVLDLVHFNHHASALADNGVQFLDDNGIPYVLTDDGEIKVTGITLNNAEIILKLYPRRGSSGEAEGVEAVNKFLLSDETILQAAQDMTAGAFKDFLRAKAIGAGIIEQPNVPQADGTMTEGLDTGEGAGGAPLPTQVETVGSKKAKVAKPDYLDQDFTTFSAHSDIDNGQYRVAEDALERLSELLAKNEVGAIEAFKFLYWHDLIQDV